jgi:hypothetical protein
MKKLIPYKFLIIAILLWQNAVYGQVINLGSAANFALFTGSGAVANTGSSTITGDIGSNLGAYEGYSGYGGKPEITITPSGKNRYDVEYTIQFGDTLIKLNGELIPFNDGRHIDYEFEIGWSQDKESEEFYDFNWEMVEYQIKSEL